MMSDKKVIISGSGKSGTTFLMNLFTRLDLDTGFNVDTMDDYISQKSFGGLEWPMRGRKAIDPSPRFLKNPSLCFDLLERAERWKWDIERVYLTIRPYGEVAAHRYWRNQDLNVEDCVIDDPGGPVSDESRKLELQFLNSLTPEQVMYIKARKASSHVGYMIEQLLDTDIPIHFIRFPRSVLDADYCREKLIDVVGHITEEKFKAVHHKVADRKKIRWSKIDG